ncbi:MAG: S8/S53 family peptidase, partial [Ktedonobacteraceae bacterium]|nr:S8/S53 family peptidase [Ktedonobacteraceae bacterium]
MRQSVRYRLVLALLVIGALGLGLYNIAIMAHAQLDQSRAVSLVGQMVPRLDRAQLLAHVGKDERLDLSIGLRMRNEQAYDRLLAQMYDPQSSLYHHFLTPQQFAEQFGATKQQQQQVVDYLRGYGISVGQIAPNGLLIDASASVAQVEAAFNVQVNYYQQGARRFYANAQPPRVPASLASLILSIGGLDNSMQMRPLVNRAPLAAGGYGPAQLLGAYDGEVLHQAGVQGEGQTVAVFELDGYKASDINQYFSQFNLGQPDLTNVLVDGFDGTAGEGAIEVELDIQVVAAMAPKAAQIVYEGPNTTQGVNDTYSRIVNDNKAKIVSVSWGLCEADSGAAELQTLDAIFKQAAGQGISVFAAAGDSGAYDCNNSSLGVDSPAGDPYVIGVGGTNLQLNSNAYGSETVWSNASDTQRGPKGSGGGGGLSSVFQQPDWQVGPGVQNQYSNGKREVPDVAADADPQTGYAVYCTVSASGCPSSGNVTVGGTSAAAPLWAGSAALMNEYLQKQGKSPLGF